MDLSVVVVNYNTAQLTSDCIRSVIEKTTGISYEIILVDNASTECDPAIFTERFPTVKLVRSPGNGGFAKGNNLGIASSSGEYILLLNSDTVLTEDSLSKTLQYLRQNPGMGVAGCRMTYPDGAIQYSARRFRSISWELLDLFRFFLFFVPYRTRSNKMLGRYFRHDENRTADWVNGAFFMFPRTVLAKLPEGKLDERFFMYAEDQLWCEQIHELGYDIGFFAGTTIIHINSGSTDRKKILRLRKTMMRHELEIMHLRKGRGLYYFVFRLLYVSKETARNIIKNIVFKLTGRLIR